MAYRLALSGMIASGKTTLAKGIAAQLGFKRVGDQDVAAEYLSDLFANPGRWALEAQMAFILRKASQLIALEQSGASYVLERSFREDRDIFLAYFREQGYLDDRGMSLYGCLYDILERSIPPVDLTIYCQATASDIKDRLRHRAQNFSYPEGHVDWLMLRFGRFETSAKDFGRTYFLSSAEVDWRVPAEAALICGDIVTILENTGRPLARLSPHC